jgi:hypothetical protein
MSPGKKTGWSILAVLIVIQFIRPALNIQPERTATDFATTWKVPPQVLHPLQHACFDCHSNRTNYPWYAHIQPVAWFLARHIRKGKAELNFSAFELYSTRRQISKLSGIGNSLKDGTMPPGSYTIMHPEARLSKEEKDVIIGWTTRARDSLRQNN